MKTIFNSFIHFIVLMLLCGGTAHAQLIMGESRVTKTVEPGDTITDEMTLQNTSDAPVDVKIYWQDFEYLAPFAGKKRFLPAGTTKRSMAGWINFSPKDMTVPAKGLRKIRYTINVPPDTKGGYNGVLFFEQGKKYMPQQNETGLAVVMRVGSLFFLNTADSSRSSKLADFKFFPTQERHLQKGDEGRAGRDFASVNSESRKASDLTMQGSTGHTLQGRITNLGDVILFPKGVYYTLDQEGKVFNRGKVEQIYLPQGESAAFEITFPGKISTAEYTVVLTFDLSEGEVLVKEIDFKVDVNSNISITALRD